MCTRRLKLFLPIVIINLLLSGCHTTSSEQSNPKNKHQAKIQYVQTDNIQWDETDEEDQELADEV